MNIFHLHDDPVLCAQSHCDKHVVKMVLEYAQLLSTAHHEVSREVVPEGIYKATHKHHPCALWACLSETNYLNLYDLFIATCDEYKHRYGRTHLTDTKLRKVLATPPAGMVDHGLTFRPKCMPDEYKVKDVIQSYRNYYLGDKAHMLQYTNRSKPEWLNQQ